jgi:S1-C subfamily serine protease
VKVTVVRKGVGKRSFDVRLIEAPPEQVAQATNQDSAPAHEDDSGTGKALGISVRQPPNEVAQELGADHTGPVVVDLDVDSPAQDRLVPASRSGIGDVITHVNGTRVKTVAEFQKAIRAVTPGDVISLRVYNPSADQSRMMRIRVPK